MRARLLAAGLALLAGSARAGVRPAWGGELRVGLPAAPHLADPARAVDPADLFLVRAVHAPLLEIDAHGALAPGLLAEVPAPEEGGRVFRLRLRPGLRFSDGAPLGAPEVAASLCRLLARDPPSPHAWVALAILGAEEVVAGRNAIPAGLQVLSATELVVTLALPLPDFPWALASLPASPVSPAGAGAGPFALVAQDPRGARLVANALHPGGRAYADGLLLSAADPRGAARALAAGTLDLVLRPEAAGPAPVATAALLATVAAVNGPRLGPGAEAVRRALSAHDRGELARLFARGPAEPLLTLAPAALLPAAPPAPAAAGAPAPPGPARLVLLVPAGAGEARAAAERIQVKLFDRGLRAAVSAEEPPRFAARLAAGDYDVALVPVPVLALRPALAAAEIALATRGPGAARQALAELGVAPPAELPARLDALARALDLVPLLATGERASAGPALQGLRPLPDGGLDPGDLWLLRGGQR